VAGRAGPAIVLGSGPRPEASTRVAIAEFDGPLGLLLALIESRRLDVLTVPLGALAGAYLEALATLRGDRIANISAFVAVAAQLILIKSRAILPRHEPGEAVALGDEDAPDPEAELRTRLILYRAHRDAGERLREGALDRVGLFRREPRAAHAAGLAGARPPTVAPLDPTILAGAVVGLLRVAPPPPMPPEVVPRTITIGERAAAIRAALAAADSIVLQELLRDVRDRVVVAVTFLAVLELSKRRELVVEQELPFGPITARRTTLAERTAAGVDADLETRPIDESMDGFA
jgi:segregation and condensation protein A